VLSLLSGRDLVREPEVAMKVVMFMLALSPAAATPTATPQALGAATAVEHGGGCRRSSPPGQCCHMETRVGRVHCH